MKEFMVTENIILCCYIRVAVAKVIRLICTRTYTTAMLAVVAITTTVTTRRISDLIDRIGIGTSNKSKILVK